MLDIKKDLEEIRDIISRDLKELREAQEAAEKCVYSDPDYYAEIIDSREELIRIVDKAMELSEE